MRMVDLIQKKRDGLAHDATELEWLIQGYSKGEIPDEQMSAWAMAVYFRGMNSEEMTELTMQMVRSGMEVDWSDWNLPGIVADKHSTGGVGDKTTIYAAPWAAACGLYLGKMSGRGLGHTGGTLDKLESIPGFKIDLPMHDFQKQVQAIGIALISQTKQLTPADAKLYALRDVTGSVASIPLIASSIMSKKIAAGAKAIVLDVKTGSGAFMKSKEDSILLAQAMVQIGEGLGRKTVAWITNMDRPLGRMIGNALEVREAIDVLHTRGSKELTELGATLISELLVAVNPTYSIEAARSFVMKKLLDGSALQKMREWVTAQGGEASVIDDPTTLLISKQILDVPAQMSGYICSIEAEAIGLSAMRLGAGRARKQDVIDHRVGIEMLVEQGQFVYAGQPLCKLYYEQHVLAEAEVSRIQANITISDQPPEVLPLLIARVDAFGVTKF